MLKNLCAISFISKFTLHKKVCNNIVINGVVTHGFGEGAFFMSMQHYKKQIKKRLGFNAYPGTLNLKVGKRQAGLLEKLFPIKIEGFKSGKKAFGGASCYRAKTKNINGYVIVPQLTRHKNNIIEFIAPIHIKSKLNIKEGDKIQIELIK